VKILIFKSGALGDILMTTPLVRQVRKQFPKAKITYLVGKFASSVIKGNPHLDRVMEYDHNIFFKLKISSYLRFVSRIRKEKFDMIFVCDRHWVYNFTSFLFGIPKRIGFDRKGREGCCLTKKVRFERRRHDVRYFLDLLKQVASVDYGDLKMEMTIEKAAKLEANTIGIAPGGGSNPGQTLDFKVWPWENYVVLIQKIIKKGYAIALIGGPDDRIIGDKILAGLTAKEKKKVKDFIGKTSIKQSAALFGQCRYAICNDSGPMHIAASQNPRVISIFGPTDPLRLAPISEESTYVCKMKRPTYTIYGDYSRCSIDDIAKVKVEDVIKHLK